MTLTEFLLARIAEDESRAKRETKAFIAGRLTDYLMGLSAMNTADQLLDAFNEAGELLVREAAGQVELDPARVLAECEAKRRIVELHAKEGQRLMPQGFVGFRGSETLRLLALPYAGHHDYDPSWSPSADTLPA